MKQRKQQQNKGCFGGWRLLLLTVALLLCLPLTVGAVSSAEGTMSEPGGFRYEGLCLCPGGCAFGIKCYTRGVLVVGLSPVRSEDGERQPAKDAGLKVKDLLLSVDGVEVNTVRDVSEAVTGSDGRALALTVEREGREKTLTLTPCLTKDGYQAGMWLRDSTAGIGTVTYVDPVTGEFGGLGHRICGPDTGALMPLRRGSAMAVEIGGVVKGQVGRPGEIKGYFRAERLGTVLGNTGNGVFGVFSAPPRAVGEPLPVGSRRELTEGEATLLCTLGDDGPQAYTVMISEIDRQGTDNKNFVVTVTDETLKARTGGIVQGMSGSPIIQDGKLVGAVTHVLVNDPARGYGIFIENMLDTAS